MSCCGVKLVINVFISLVFLVMIEKSDVLSIEKAEIGIREKER